MLARWQTIFIVIVGCLFGLKGGSVFALGETDASSTFNSPTANPSLQTVPLSVYGYADTIRLSGADAKTVISIPVYPGLIPTSLRLKVISTPNIDKGFISFEYENATFFSLPLPTTNEPIIVPLSGLKPKDDRLELTINGIFSTEDETCAAFRSRWIDISELAVGVSGLGVPPATVAEFFSPTLRRLSLYVGSSPSPALLDAAFKLAAFAQHAAAAKAIDVTIIASSTARVDTGEDPYTRTVVFADGKENSLKLIPTSSLWPYLLITSGTSTWATTIKPLVDERTNDLLQTDLFAVSSADRSPSTSALQVSFADLGTPLIRLQGAGEIRGSLSVPQAAFGTMIAHPVLTLRGYSSVLQKDGVARLDTYFNNRLLDSFSPPNQGGNFNRTFKLENDYLRRDNQLDFVLTYTPPGGNCRVGIHNMVLDIMGTSTIAATTSPLIPPSFDRYPQTLLPTFNLVLDSADTDVLTAAARLIILWQRLSPRVLSPHVIWLSQFKKEATPTVIITPDAAHLPSLALFLNPDTFELRENGLLENMNTLRSFAVMQSFLENEVPYFVLTSHWWKTGLTAPTDYLLAREGWYDAKGNVLVVTPQGKHGSAELASLNKLPLRYGIWGSGITLSRHQKVLYGLIAFGVFTLLVAIAATLGYTYKKREHMPQPATLSFKRNRRKKIT